MDTTLTPGEQAAVKNLRTSVEYQEGEFGVAYLDNAKPATMSGPTWAATLASLTKKGLYKPMDQFFGKIKSA